METLKDGKLSHFKLHVHTHSGLNTRHAPLGAAIGPGAGLPQDTGGGALWERRPRRDDLVVHALTF